MDKIKTPQCLVSYAGGSGGEWLAIQIGKHDKFYNEELVGDCNELNRWRMKGSWRQYILDHTDIKNKLWTERDYDNSPEWWEHFWNNAPDKEICYNQVREIMNKKAQYTIPVHRCHEAWYDVYWRDMFEEFKIVTIRVDDTNERVLRQFQGNIIKKIFWQDFDANLLEHELRDKCKKHRVDYDACMYYIGRFMDTVNYTDMMLGINLVTNKSDYLAAVEATMNNMAERWNDYNVKQHHHPIEGGYVVDFGRMFVDKDYKEYVNLCEYLGMTPWYEDQWSATIDEYADEDMKQVITVENVKERLWNRISEII